MSSKIVIGAYGKRSSLDVRLERDFIKRKSPYLAVKTHVKGKFHDDVVALHNFKELGVDSVEIVVGNIDHTLPEWLQSQQKTVDMVFFDANHRLEPTLRYFEDTLPYANDDSVFIFDDIYWSKEMTQAWEQIKAHPDVRVTVDLFWVGLVFFRKEQAKESFVLRF